MRIAVITASFLPRIGGAEFVVDHLSRQWSTLGHDVTVFNLTTGEAPPGAPYRVRQYRSLPGAWRFGRHRFPFSGHATRQLGRYIAAYRPDFISAHFAYPTAVWLSRLNPVPRYIVTCHGPALDESPTGPRARYGVDELIRWAIDRASGVVAISSHARRVLTSLGVSPEKIIDISNGVDTQRFGKIVAGFDLRTRFDLPADARILLSVGRDTPEKAYDVAMRAFAGAARHDRRLHYLVLGRGTSRWKDLTRELGVVERVRFCDGLHGDDLVAAYQQSDIFLLSSRQELCPLVVPEAMAAGLPEVVTDVSGSQDMILDGENGFVVAPGDDRALSDAIRRLADDAPLRERMGQANRERARLYDWTRISREYLKHAPSTPTVTVDRAESVIGENET